MKKLLIISILLLVGLNGFGQKKLKTIEIKLDYKGIGFKEYHSKIQKCNPCFLIVKDSSNSIIAESIGTQVGNETSHHFFILKPDSVIQEMNPPLNSSTVSMWSNDSIVSFIKNNYQYVDAF